MVDDVASLLASGNAANRANPEEDPELGAFANGGSWNALGTEGFFEAFSIQLGFLR